MKHRRVTLIGLLIGIVLISSSFADALPSTWMSEPLDEVAGLCHLSDSAGWTRTARIVTPYDYPDEEWTTWEDAVDRTVADGANVILDWADFSDTYPGRVLDPAPGLADLQQRVEYVHTHHPGVRMIVYIAPLEMQTPDADMDMDGQPDPGVHTAWTDHPDWLQMGIDGRRAVFYGSMPGMPFWVEPTDEDVWLCPNVSEYRNHIMGLAGDIAATGVDGVWFDVPFFVHDFGEGWQEQWPCHCSTCRVKFQADTGHALPEPPSTPDWDDPAWQAFVAWRYEQTSGFIADFDSALKAVNPDIQLIIETSVGPGVTATQHGNSPLDLPGVSDLTAHEYGGPFTATKYYGWLAMLADLLFWRHTDGDQPSWLLSYVEAGHPGTVDVARLHAGSVLTAGFNYYTSGTEGMAGAPDLDFRRQLFGWLAGHDGAYYDDLQPYANVALLFSRQTLDHLDRGSWDSEYAYHDEWKGMAMMLLESHIPYQVITKVELTAKTLAEYEALVLPLFGAVSTALAQAIRDYVAGGGTIVATGATSLFDAQGQQLPDFQLADVFGVSYNEADYETVYVNDYGAGRSTFSLYPYPREYFWAAAPILRLPLRPAQGFGSGQAWGGGNPAQAEAIRQAFLAELWNPAAITPVLSTDAPRGVVLLPFAGHEEVVVRAVNYVGVNTGDAVPTPQDDLSLTITLPAGRSATAGEMLDYLGDVQPLSFPAPASPDVQVTFDLDISAVLSFTTTTAWPCQIPGDLDCDCDVDVLDIMIVASLWRTAEGDEDYAPLYDLDDDGDIDVVDIMLVAVHWGETCG
ncbi:MAG: beta-galactosidase trimerization domain-containing protein [Anaerolineae bacterium]